jgi:hypothetical protein
LLKVVKPVTPSVLLRVVAPVTPSVPPIVALPEAPSEVNAPVEAVVPPIGVLLIEPVVIAVAEIVPPVIAALDDPKLLAVTKPLELTERALVPLALTLNGFSVEPLAVATLSRYPVPELEAVSARLNKFALPVVAP